MIRREIMVCVCWLCDISGVLGYDDTLATLENASIDTVIRQVSGPMAGGRRLTGTGFGTPFTPRTVLCIGGENSNGD
jgi:hypothetical protein